VTRGANHAGVQHSHAEPTGALAIRIWVEQVSPVQLRARITHSSDLEGREHVTSAAGSADEIEKTVRLWLESFVGSIELIESGWNS
jgi:hypothetical protein